MKSLKKALPAIIAVTMAIYSLALSVSAAEFTGSVKVAAYVFETVEWQKKVSNVVDINGYGTYTVSISGISVPVEAIGSLYLKDYDFETVNEGLGKASNVNSDIIINTKSFKLNGNEYQLTEGYGTGLNTGGIFEVTYMNVWADSYVAPTDITTIESVEITFEITSPDGETGPANSEEENTSGTDNAVSEELPAEETTPEEPVDEPADEPTVEEPAVNESEETAATAATAASAAPTAAAGDTNAPAANASNAEKGAADTGVEGVSILIGIAVVGTGSVIILRRKSR